MATGSGHEVAEEAIEKSTDNNHFAAIVIKAKTNLLKSLFAHRATEFGPFLGIKHQESTATRANQFAAKCAMGHGKFIKFIDALVTDSARPLFLVLPMHIHE